MTLRIILGCLLPLALIADPVSIQISGTPQPVFYYPTDHCQSNYNAWQQGALDFPDEPARAFIGPDGKVQLMATNSHGLYRSIGGTSLNAPFKRDCSPILTSQYQNIGAASAPNQYTNQLWIWSLWADETTQGKNVYALIHNEFHGELNPNYCASTNKNNCWYSNIVSAVSRNAGKSYDLVSDNNNNPLLTFASPLPYSNDSGRHGMPNSSSIVKNFINSQDKYFYTLVLSNICGRNQSSGKPFCNNTPIDRSKWAGGMCVYRTASITTTPHVGSQWLGFDGTTQDFTVDSSQNPYTQTIKNLNNAVCTPVLPGLFRFGLSFNSVINQYIALGLDTAFPTPDGKTISTIVYAISQGSLTSWDTGPNQHGYCIQDQQGACIQINWMKPSSNPAVYSMGYPTLIDANSPSISSGYGYTAGSPDINFQFTGASPYLYYVMSYPQDKNYGMRHRDLMRLPLSVVGSSNE